MRALIVLIAVFGIFLFLRWLLRQPPKVMWQFAAVAVGTGLILLAATGRMHWLTAVFGALLPFARRLLGLLGYLPLLQRLASQLKTAQSTTGPSTGNASTVESRFIRMTLDHDSGEMDGEILDGRFSGRRLSNLTLDDLIDLHNDCCADQESTKLLDAYLDRIYGEDWHTRAQGADETHTSEAETGIMSQEEAYEVLGLEAGAKRDEIIEAHRRLMQKLHPDRGGSTYLAAKINRAKDILLDL